MSISPDNSPFLCAASVEAWDAWFRWRDANGLHDVAIEDTWQRIGAALAAAEAPAQRAAWQARFVEEMAQWRLLPDERLYRLGTGAPPPGRGPLHATLNAARFVFHPGTPAAFLDYGAVARSAGVALRMLDDALLLAGRSDAGVRIGVMGMGDALALLDLDYAGEAARDTARRFAEALDAGCRQADRVLAAERGATASAHGDLPLAVARRYPSAAARRVDARPGWRCRSITAIDPQRRLAVLANDVTSALDPLPSGWRTHRIGAPGGARLMASPGYVAALLHRHPSPERDAAGDDVASCLAQLRLRAAMQPQIDEPIDYPLALAHRPDDAIRGQVAALARQLGVAMPRWPLASASPPAPGSLRPRARP